MSHTLGPWEVSGTSVVSKRHCIAVIEDDGGYEAPRSERDANAKLIAAAPDLLDALCMLVRSVREAGWHRSTTESALEAIEKATGYKSPE